MNKKRCEKTVKDTPFDRLKQALADTGLILETDAEDTQELLEELEPDQISVEGALCTAMCVYWADGFNIYMGRTLVREIEVGPPLYCFFTKYDDEDEAVFAGGATFTELDKIIRKLPDYCHYIDVNVQLKLGTLLTNVPFVRSLPLVEYYPQTMKERRTIEDVISQLREGFLNGDQRIEVFKHGQSWYYKLSNADYRTIAGKQHLAIKRILYSEGKLLTSNGRLDYKPDSRSNAMTYILISSEGRSEVIQQYQKRITEQAKDEQLDTEQPKAEQPKPEQPKAEQPKAEQPKAEQPKPEQPKPEQPQIVVVDGDDTQDKLLHGKAALRGSK